MTEEQNERVKGEDFENERQGRIQRGLSKNTRTTAIQRKERIVFEDDKRQKQPEKKQLKTHDVLEKGERYETRQVENVKHPSSSGTKKGAKMSREGNTTGSLVVNQTSFLFVNGNNNSNNIVSTAQIKDIVRRRQDDVKSLGNLQDSGHHHHDCLDCNNREDRDETFYISSPSTAWTFATTDVKKGARILNRKEMVTKGKRHEEDAPDVSTDPSTTTTTAALQTVSVTSPLLSSPPVLHRLPVFLQVSSNPHSRHRRDGKSL